ncbi:MAG: hypothetical protein IPL79_04860 [Myxococcales bacterium]|nr:hypothetical protein [Myxococcales bacterium]
MRLAMCCFVGLAACSERAPRERPRADVPAVQVAASAEAMPLVEVRAREPNDTWEAATPLAVGEQAHDAMSAASDRDIFALAIDRPRVIAVTLSALADADLVLEISDTSGTVLAIADTGPAGTVEGVPNLRLEPGRYAITVTEFVKKAARPRKGAKDAAPATPASRDPGQAKYTLAIADAAVALEDEREPNETAPQASPLALAESKKGFVGWRGDRDVWQLATEGLSVDNVIDVQVMGVPGVTLTVEVLGADEVAEPLMSRRAKTTGPFFLRGLPVAAGAAWLRISGSPANPLTSYEVQFFARYAEPDVGADAPAESEPNDRAETATRLSEQGVLGWLDQGDVDVFEVEAQLSAIEVVVVPSEFMDVALEETAGGKVLRTANAGALGVSERLPLAAGRAASFAVRPVKRRGETTLGGGEARYKIERIEVTPAPAALAPGDDAPEPSP